MDEIWNRYLPHEECTKINRVGHVLTKMLCHSDLDWHPPVDPMDSSVSTVAALNALIMRKELPEDTVPGDLYKYLILFRKDAGRPRYRMLVRDPSREETVSTGAECFSNQIRPCQIRDAGENKCMIHGKIFLRTRCAQGHSEKETSNGVDHSPRLVSRVGM